MKQWPDAEVLHIKESPFVRVQNQISTPSDLPVFSYSKLKRSECLCTSPRVSNNEWTFVNKILGLSLSVKLEWFVF